MIQVKAIHKSDIAPLTNTSKMKIKRGINFKIKHSRNDYPNNTNDELKLDTLESNRIINSSIGQTTGNRQQQTGSFNTGRGHGYTNRSQVPTAVGLSNINNDKDMAKLRSKVDNSLKKGQMDFLRSEAQSNARTIDLNLQKIQPHTSGSRIGFPNCLLNKEVQASKNTALTSPEKQDENQGGAMSLEQYKIQVKLNMIKQREQSSSRLLFEVQANKGHYSSNQQHTRQLGAASGLKAQSSGAFINHSSSTHNVLRSSNDNITSQEILNLKQKLLNTAQKESAMPSISRMSIQNMNSQHVNEQNYRLTCPSNLDSNSKYPGLQATSNTGDIVNIDASRFILPSKVVTKQVSIKNLQPPKGSISRLSNGSHFEIEHMMHEKRNSVNQHELANHQLLKDVLNQSPSQSSQVFEGMRTIFPNQQMNSKVSQNIMSTNPSEQTVIPSQTSAQLMNPQLKLQIQQQISHQINLSIGKMHQTKLKDAIQKQIVEFAQRQPSLQQLNSVCNQRPLAGIAKSAKYQFLQQNIDSNYQLTGSVVSPLNPKIGLNIQSYNLQPKVQTVSDQQDSPDVLERFKSENKSQRLDYISRIILQGSKDSELMKNNMFSQKRFSAQLENKFEGDQTFFLDDQQQLRTVHGGQADNITINTEYEQVNGNFSSPQPQKQNVFGFPKKDQMNFVQSPKILYNGEQKAKAYQAQQSFCEALGTGNSLQHPQVFRPHYGTQDPNFLHSDGKMSMLTNECVQTRQTSLKTTLTEKDIQKNKNFTEYHVDLHLTPKNYSSEPEGPQVNGLSSHAATGASGVEVIAQKIQNGDVQQQMQQTQGGQSSRDTSAVNKTLQINQIKNINKRQSPSNTKLRIGKSIHETDFIKLKSIQPFLTPKFGATGQQLNLIQNPSHTSQPQNHSSLYYNYHQTNQQRRAQSLLMEAQQKEMLEKIAHEEQLQQARYQAHIDAYNGTGTEVQIQQAHLSQVQPTGIYHKKMGGNRHHMYYKNSQKGMIVEIREKEQNSQYAELFAKLGLDYDMDVPANIKEQIKVDKEAKQILIQLGNELEAKSKHLINEKSNKHGDSKIEARKKARTYIPSAPQRQIQECLAEINTQAINPNACFSNKPGEPTQIHIINDLSMRHQNHPINKYVKQSNDFCYLTLIRATNYRGSSQKCPSFDIPQIQNLAKQLKIEIPKNLTSNEMYNTFRSKQFIVQTKSTILQKLFALLNKENDIELKFERSQFKFYKGYIGKGNNTQLIVQLFKQHRWWWSIYQALHYDEDGQPILPFSQQQQNNANGQPFNIKLYKENFTEHNFLWTQWKKLKHFPHLKPVKSQDVREGENMSNYMRVYAKLENNYHLSNKYALFYNMRKYYKACQRDPFDVLPLTFHVKRGTSDAEFGKFLNVYKLIENQKAQAAKEEKELLKKQKGLLKEIKVISKKLQKLSNSLSVSDNEGGNEYDSDGDSPTEKETPQQSRRQNTSFLPDVPDVKKEDQKIIIDEQLLRKMHIQKQNNIMEQERHSLQRIRLQNQLNETKVQLQQCQQTKNQKNIWILKPGENTNRGVGITVETKLDEIKSYINSESGNSRTFIIQKYIENPALFKNRKFDIRCFALVTSVNGNLMGFTYDDGYLRTSAKEFNLKNFNKFIHLTNDAVQKRSDDYGRFEFGNKVSFLEYQQYLNLTVPHLNINFQQHIFSQIKRIMGDTICACYKSLDPEKRHHSFEILGYDFMLDDNFKVYLIEANTNPCLETTCPILHKIITDVVDSGLRIALDPLFPPPNFEKRMSTQIPLTQYELCYDSKIDNREMDKLYSDYEIRQEEILVQKNKKETVQEQEATGQTATTASGETSSAKQAEDASTKEQDGTDENIIDNTKVQEATTVAEILNNVLEKDDDFDEEALKEEQNDEYD